jgi:hypothetical protein
MEAAMHHELKILPAYFEAVIDGWKTFEIRKDDRGFQPGDAVTLREYDPEYTGDYQHDDDKYTGRTHSATIGYVSTYEQQRGYVVFSLLPNA